MARESGSGGLRRLIGGLFPARGEAAPAEAPLAPPAPEEPIAVIGDIHGALPLLEALLARLDAEAPGHRRIFVGDYIDRGEHSAGVLARVRSEAAAGAVALMGNHEAMMLDFIADPAAHGPRWLLNGGLQTLTSFGLPAVPPTAPADRLEEAARALAEAMGETLEWLRLRPLMWRSGNVAVVHGMASPERPLEEQGAETLLWRRPRPGDRPRPDGVWIVHGHTITERPELAPGRINVDTGAFATGRLTAVLLAPGAEPRFVSTAD